jgi:hypothetical protein
MAHFCFPGIYDGIATCLGGNEDAGNKRHVFRRTGEETN